MGAGILVVRRVKQMSAKVHFSLELHEKLGGTDSVSRGEVSSLSFEGRYGDGKVFPKGRLHMNFFPPLG